LLLLVVLRWLQTYLLRLSFQSVQMGLRSGRAVARHVERPLERDQLIPRWLQTSPHYLLRVLTREDGR
jgi:hypothetical protein